MAGLETADEAQVQDASTQLAVLMFTDVAGSVELKTRLGARSYERLIARHDALFAQVLKQSARAAILNDMGDGYLTRFDTPAEGVLAAIRFQRALKNEAWGSSPVLVRIGLDIGQITYLKEGERTRIVGLPVDTAARFMGLAQPGQTLLTRTVFENARQYLRTFDDDPQGPVELRWNAYGYYAFKGLEDPLEVFEVGLPGLSPLTPPPDSDKALRVATAGGDPDWRPAAEQEVPGRRGWVLKRKLGEGGFGEVWLARHRRTSDERVFKFCFDEQKLESLRREAALFRLIRDKLGNRSDIARLHELEIEQPPYFLECEYSEHGSLLDWVKRQGGLERVPLPVRLDLVARAARATHAAHSVGILHKDIKPANILIYQTEDGQPRPKLADFGIGEVTERATHTGMQTAGWATTIGRSSGLRYTGTQMYTPPEVQAGERFTACGDVYALGVLLYQLAAGDLHRPMGQGWQRYISDARLADLIARCVDVDPQQRLQSAEALACEIAGAPAPASASPAPAADAPPAQAARTSPPPAAHPAATAAAPARATPSTAPRKSAGLRPLWVLAGVGGLAVVAVGIALLMIPRGKAPGPSNQTEPRTGANQPAPGAPAAPSLGPQTPASPKAQPPPVRSETPARGDARSPDGPNSPQEAPPVVPDGRAALRSACERGEELLARKEYEAAIRQYEEALNASRGLAAREVLRVRCLAGQALAVFYKERSTPHRESDAALAAAAQVAADVLQRSYGPLKAELGEAPIVKLVLDGILESLMQLNRLDEAQAWADRPDEQAARFRE
ncbi:MAG: protein kinase [Phycisphaerae bacterium]|nr:protein kinase [Phycisphaerae bacterium]MCZ2400482.1 protein kinase [Phycisphaerae bacterium]